MSFYGQWNPPVDQVLLMNYFEGKDRGTFLECGAADGVSLSCCKFFEDIGWRGINIEGSRPHFEKLVEIRPKSLLNLHAALSDHDGVVIFRNEVVERPAKDGENGTRAIRLASALAEAAVEQLDLLCLDIEGHEPMVLADMMRCSVRPRVICAEYPHCGLRAIADALMPTYGMDGISFNNAYFSLKDVTVRRPFWGRTAEVFVREGHCVFPEKAELD